MAKENFVSATYAANLRRLMKQEKVSVRLLAEQLLVSESVVRKILYQQTSYINPEVFDGIRRLFNVTANDLLEPHEP